MKLSETSQAGTRPAGRPGAGHTAAPRPAWALAALLGAMFLGNVDVAIANIAGPSIRAGLHASGGELELVVSGYTLAYAVLLVTSARLGQARGYRPVFLAGLGGFTAASLACGLAPSALVLVIARIVAGAAAALMAAQVLTGIQLSFAGRARSRAPGLYSLVLSAGAVAGQSLGGLLISADVLGATWRPAFLVNVPAGMALAWLAWRYLPARRGQPQRLDLAGVVLFSAAMLLLVLPLVLGQDAGWPAWTWACLAASAPAFAALQVVERKVSARGGQPLVDPRLIARPEIGWVAAWVTSGPTCGRVSTPPVTGRRWAGESWPHPEIPLSMLVGALLGATGGAKTHAQPVCQRSTGGAETRPQVGPFLALEASWGLASQAVATATYFAVLFTLALYLQQGLGKSAAYSGLALVSWVAAFGIPGPVLGRFPAQVRALAAPAGAVILAAGFAGLGASLYAGDTSAVLLMTLLGVAGLGLGTTFTGMLSHLTSSVTGEHAAGISGLFNTTTRAGGVIGTAAFGTAYLALVHDPGQAVHGFAMVNLALAAAALAVLSVRQREATVHA